MATADPFQDLDPRLARALSALREELDERLAALRAELGLGERRTDTARPAAPDYEALLEIVRRLDEADDQVELLGRMLEGAGRFAGRALFLPVRGDAVEGWGGFGFPPASAAEVRSDLAALAPLARCVERGESVALSSVECAELLGPGPSAGRPAEGLLVPFALRNRVAAVLYVDRAAGESLVAPALQLLAYTTANTLETLPLRKPAPAATTVEPEATATGRLGTLVAEPEPEAVPPATAAPEVEDRPAEEPAGEPEATESAAPAAEAAVETESPAETAKLGPFDTLTAARSAVEVAEPPGTEELPDLAAPASAAPAADVERASERPAGDGSAEVAPPPDLEGPGWAFRERRTAAEDSRREEARRLARLLVTEIKLYNEEQVEEGLERGNLYAALQEEIDRSRRIFEERIPADVRAETDYFRDELVRILADGDSSALGL